jgi:kallikrein 8 (neuropsin/ovasin)
MHPDYVSGPNFYDVAVIRTARMTFGELVQPIALSNHHVGVGVEGVFTGWGFVGYGPFLPRRADLLQKMNTRTISNEQCREMYSVTRRAQFVVDQKLCILSIEGPRTTVCGGDSGTPLVVNGSVVGVTSWRTNPCGDGLPDVFIRVSVVHDWIMSNI